jgi:hypothetical protein
VVQPGPESGQNSPLAFAQTTFVGGSKNGQTTEHNKEVFYQCKTGTMLDSPWEVYVYNPEFNVFDYIGKVLAPLATFEDTKNTALFIEQ